MSEHKGVYQDGPAWTPVTGPELDGFLSQSNPSDGKHRVHPDTTPGTYAEGATGKVIVRTRRSGTPDVDSTGSTIYTATATLLGPSAVQLPTVGFASVADQKQGTF